jgi:hypothetical protein
MNHDDIPPSNYKHDNDFPIPLSLLLCSLPPDNMNKDLLPHLNEDD